MTGDEESAEQRRHREDHFLRWHRAAVKVSAASEELRLGEKRS